MYPEDAVSDVPPIGPAQGSSIDPLATGVAPRDASDLPFGLGQHVLARVLQMVSSESVLLEISGQRFTTSTPVPLVPGQILDVAVRSTGTVVDLELLDPPDVISDRAYALASVIEARHASAASAPPSLEAIRTLLASLPPVRPGEDPVTPQASLSARAAAALLPAPLDADGARLATTLRHAVTASGLFFEARLAAALPPEAGRADLAAVADDRRAVLAELAARGIQSPPFDETRAALAADLLSRQVEVAYHRVKDGELRLDVPVMIGATPADVHLRVREDRGTAAEGEPASGRTIDLMLDLPELGRVRASIGWTPGQVSTRLRVAAPSQAETLESGLSELDARLRAVGFRHVAVSVQIDPDALVSAAESPEPPLPGGSILHVRV
jgi:hypothetical protein